MFLPKVTVLGRHLYLQTTKNKNRLTSILSCYNSWVELPCCPTLRGGWWSSNSLTLTNTAAVSSAFLCSLLKFQLSLELWMLDHYQVLCVHWECWSLHWEYKPRDAYWWLLFAAAKGATFYIQINIIYTNIKLCFYWFTKIFIIIHSKQICETS